MNRNKLGDGTIIESNLSVKSTNELSHVSSMFQYNNTTMKVGNVIEILYPENVNNITKKVIEYNVSVLERSPDGSSQYNTYNNCIVSNMFGSSNNYTNQTFQAASGDYKGASVILECIDGNSQGGSAVIIGGLDATSTNKVYSAKDGQFYDFNFNGIQQLINNDGEYSLIFNSKIDTKGKRANDTAAGTFIKIDKDGRLSLGDNQGQLVKFDRVDQSAIWTNGAEFIKLDKKNKTLSMNSSDKMSLTSTGAMSFKSSSTIDSTSEKDYNISSSSNIAVRSKANTNMKADAGMNLEAGAVFKAKGGASAIIEGETVAQIKGLTTLIGDGVVGIGAVGISMSLGFDSHGSPVVSTMLTGSFTCFVGT